MYRCPRARSARASDLHVNPRGDIMLNIGWMSPVEGGKIPHKCKRYKSAGFYDERLWSFQDKDKACLAYIQISNSLR